MYSVIHFNTFTDREEIENKNNVFSPSNNYVSAGKTEAKKTKDIFILMAFTNTCNKINFLKGNSL